MPLDPFTAGSVFAARHTEIGVEAVGDEGLRAVDEVVIALRMAVVRMPCTSEPAPGSVIASAVTTSPLAIAGSHAPFCWSLP